MNFMHMYNAPPNLLPLPPSLPPSLPSLPPSPPSLPHLHSSCPAAPSAAGLSPISSPAVPAAPPPSAAASRPPQLAHRLGGGGEGGREVDKEEGRVRGGKEGGRVERAGSIAIIMQYMCVCTEAHVSTHIHKYTALYMYMMKRLGNIFREL